MPEFRMPSLGADMQEGTLLEWLVGVGDPVHRGDVVAVVDTDKAAVEVECFADGVVQRLLVDPGQKVPVGTPLATIGVAAAVAKTEAAEPEAAEPRVAAPAVAVPSAAVPPAAVPSVAVPAAAVPPSAPKVVSPLVRHLAEKRGVDLSTVTPSGPGGVVHRADLGAAAPPPTPLRPRTATPRTLRASPLARRLAARAGVELTTVTGTGAGGAITAADVRRATAGGAATPAAAPVRPPTEPSRSDRAAAMRRAIAELMERSNREIPHYYLTRTIDLTAAVAWLHERNRKLPVPERLLPAALLTAATVRAVRDVPQLNGHWIDDAFRPAAGVDLGLVVSLRAGGIMVPVVTGAQARSVAELMSAIRDLAVRARSGRLRASELGMPTLTLSNLGDQGVDEVLGVIYPPQVALVGFGAVLDRVVAVGGLVGVRPTVTASLAADHRASDGAVGARFLNRIDELLQNPEEL